jgi:uncharacterized membrane protein
LRHIFSKDFKYTTAIETNLRETFRRVRKEQERAKKEAEDARRQVTDLLTRKPLCK